MQRNQNSLRELLGRRIKWLLILFVAILLWPSKASSLWFLYIKLTKRRPLICFQTQINQELSLFHWNSQTTLQRRCCLNHPIRTKEVLSEVWTTSSQIKEVQPKPSWSNPRRRYPSKPRSQTISKCSPSFELEGRMLLTMIQNP